MVSLERGGEGGGVDEKVLLPTSANARRWAPGLWRLGREDGSLREYPLIAQDAMNGAPECSWNRAGYRVPWAKARIVLGF
jgi:hypothetical protein